MRGTGVVLILCAASAVAHAQDQQLGARTKAMGGSYTAFQDDPLLVWLNPAGISTQPDQMSIVYQTYTGYPREEAEGPGGSSSFSVEGQIILPDPAYLPSYVGFVFQVGTPEEPMAVGVGFARPYNLGYSMDEVQSPLQTVFEPRFEVEESLSRFRVALARDFRLRKAGEAGTFTHVAVGVGGDLGYEQWRFTPPPGDARGERHDASAALGFGAGVLVGLYEDPDSLSLHFGAAYQSRVEFDFGVDPDLIPAFDMPEQFNVGLTAYFHRGFPLRVTFDTQFIGWEATAEDPKIGSHPTFRDSVNFSLGLEYRVDASERLVLLPRLGYRRFQAPWEDEDDLPATSRFKLVLDTRDSEFDILTFGMGFSWTTEARKVRTIDVAGETGGDSFNVALGYTHEF
jgi:long-subunit fatty acid transport protein